MEVSSQALKEIINAFVDDTKSTVEEAVKGTACFYNDISEMTSILFFNKENSTTSDVTQGLRVLASSADDYSERNITANASSFRAAVQDGVAELPHNHANAMAKYSHLRPSSLKMSPNTNDNDRSFLQLISDYGDDEEVDVVIVGNKGKNADDKDGDNEEECEAKNDHSCDNDDNNHDKSYFLIENCYKEDEHFYINEKNKGIASSDEDSEEKEKNSAASQTRKSCVKTLSHQISNCKSHQADVLAASNPTHLELATANNWFNDNNNNDTDSDVQSGDVTFMNSSTSDSMTFMQGVDSSFNNSDNAHSDNVKFMNASTSDAMIYMQGVDNSLNSNITHTTQKDSTTSAQNVTTLDSNTAEPNSSLVAVDTTASGTCGSGNHRKRAMPAHSNTDAHISNGEITEADEYVKGGLAPKRRKLSQDNNEQDQEENEVMQDDEENEVLQNDEENEVLQDDEENEVLQNDEENEVLQDDEENEFLQDDEENEVLQDDKGNEVLQDDEENEVLQDDEENEVLQDDEENEAPQEDEDNEVQQDEENEVLQDDEENEVLQDDEENEIPQDDEENEAPQDDEENEVQQDEENEVLQDDKENEVLQDDEENEILQDDEENEVLQDDEENEVLQDDEENEVLQDDEENEGLQDDEENEVPEDDEENEVPQDDEENEVLQDEKNEVPQDDEENEVLQDDEENEVLQDEENEVLQDDEENEVPQSDEGNEVPQYEDEISDICANEQTVAQSGVSETEEQILQCCACMLPFAAKKTVRCNKSHIICKACLKAEIIKTVTSDKMTLSCPVALCTDEISLDALKCLQPSFCIDVLIENIYRKQDAASQQAITELKGVVSCPECQATAQIDDDVVFFTCFNENCKKVSCRYCKSAFVAAQENYHYYECYLLHFVGTECLKNILVPPANWNNNDAVNVIKEDGFESIFLPLESQERKTIAEMFSKTSNSTVNYVFRVQNQKCWETYILKRKHLIEEIGEENLSERLLYHGTTHDSVSKILKEGFDCRKPSINGTYLGKGNYFSTTANYSERFAQGANVLLLARVLCGYSAIGSDANTHPPYSTSGRMFDSCVDELPNPSMYIVYSNDQCYPEYAISYTPLPAPANSA